MKKQIGLIALTALLVSFVACSGVASAQASNVQVVFFTSPMCAVCQQVHPLVESAAAKYGVNLIVYDVSTTEGKGIAQANSVSSTPTIVISGAQPARFEGAVTQAQIEAAIKAAIGTATPTEGAVTQAQIEAAIKEAIGTATPTATPTPSPSPSPTPIPQETTSIRLVTQPTQDSTAGGPAASTSESTQETAGFLLVQPLTYDAPSTQLTSGSSSSQNPILTSSVLVPTVPSAVAASASTMLAEASALSQGSVPSISLPAAQTNDATKLPTQSVFEFSLLGLGAPTLLIGVLYLLLRRV